MHYLRSLPTPRTSPLATPPSPHTTLPRLRTTPLVTHSSLSSLLSSYHSSLHAPLLSPLLRPRTPLLSPRTPLLNPANHSCRIYSLHALCLSPLFNPSMSLLFCVKLFIDLPIAPTQTCYSSWLCPSRPSLLNSPLLFLRTQHSSLSKCLKSSPLIRSPLLASRTSHLLSPLLSPI